MISFPVKVAELKGLRKSLNSAVVKLCTLKYLHILGFSKLQVLIINAVTKLLYQVAMCSRFAGLLGIDGTNYGNF